MFYSTIHEQISDQVTIDLIIVVLKNINEREC